MKKHLLFTILGILGFVGLYSQQTNYVAADGSFTLAMGPNDDGSSNAITLPFNFCLYGQNYNTVYINNNGNVSFTSPYSSFSSTGFPVASYAMIAPFWADVDTRASNGGTVNYKITPTAFYVNWDAVGYYSQQADKLNSFQLIITNSLDPILPAGDNIGFFYGDMQWTTGSASSGVNGFGGIPSTVGINKGDGLNYLQIGRFDHSGNSYDGPQGAADGVDWLDNKHFYFDGCTFPTATIIGTTTICNNSFAPNISIIGSGGVAPYTFTYTINGGSVDTVSTVSGDTANIPVPTNVTGSFTYQLVSVQSSASSTVAQTQGSATVTINPCTMATATIVGSDTVCKNATAPTITFTGSLGTAPYTFTYNINGGVNQTLTTTSDSSATVTASTATAGTYIYNLVSVKDATATTPSPANGSVVIRVVDPSASVLGSTTVCQFDSPPNYALIGAGGIAPYTFTYNVNNGSNITVTSAGDTAFVSLPTVVPGSFLLNLINVKDASPDSCSTPQNDSALITVNPLPSASIAGTTSVCENDSAPKIILKGMGATAPYAIVYSINGINQSPITTVAGDSAIVLVPTNSSGTFVYSLVSVQDASATACLQSQNSSVAVTIKPKPHASFSGTNVCLGNSLQFTDSSSTTSGTITSWAWNFGDNSPVESVQNPSYVYANSGTYTVTLRVDNSFGCVDSTIKPIKIYPNPSSNFTHNNVCLGDSIHFVNTTSIASPATISSYLWVFGDGSATSSLINPVHYYSSANTYNVALISTSTDGCTGVINIPVKTFAPPIASFLFTSNCLHDSAHFQNTSIPPNDGSIASWKWVFSDTTTPDSVNFSSTHLFDSIGSYIITLITHSSNLGCADSVSDTLVVYPKPSANFNSSDVCLHNTSVFSDSSFVVADSVVGWSWNFNDGSSLNTTQNPTHVYASAQTYSVIHKVVSSHGCVDSIAKPTIIHPLPMVQYSSLNVCDGFPTFFNSNSTIINGDSIVSYSWSYGDGSPVNSGSQTTHEYGNVGSYNVTLTATSNFGCMDSLSKASVLSPVPIVNFIAASVTGCEPLCVTFNDSSSISSGNNKFWQWNFGDSSSPDSMQSPVHCYHNDSVSSAVVFPVTLQVTSDSGCTSTKTIDSLITVYPKPVAEFIASPTTTTTIVTSAIEIKDTSIGANVWSWDFGDLFYDTSKTPKPHLYSDTGVYQITLIVSTNYGCKDTAYHIITVEPDFVFYVPNTFSPNNDGVNDLFLTKGYFIEQFELMIFDRWGNMVFYSKDINEGWDGRANLGSKTAQQDVFVYSIHLRDNQKQKHSYTGTVTIVR